MNPTQHICGTHAMNAHARIEPGQYEQSLIAAAKRRRQMFFGQPSAPKPAPENGPEPCEAPTFQSISLELIQRHAKAQQRLCAKGWGGSEAIRDIIDVGYRHNVHSMRPSLAQIIRATEVEYKLPRNTITGACRSRKIAEARHKAIARARDMHPDKTLPQLGQAFNRDHTTILYALRKTGRFTASEEGV